MSIRNLPEIYIWRRVTLKNIILEKCLDLYGAPLKYIGRACEMIWMGFGEMHDVYKLNGTINKEASMAIHLFCLFRIFLKDKIFITNDEICYSFDKDNQHFSWSDKTRESIFDHKIKNIYG